MWQKKLSFLPCVQECQSGRSGPTTLLLTMQAICYISGHSKLRNARGEEAEALHIAHVIHRHIAPLTSSIFFLFEVPS